MGVGGGALEPVDLEVCRSAGEKSAVGGSEAVADEGEGGSASSSHESGAVCLEEGLGLDLEEEEMERWVREGTSPGYFEG